MRIVGFVGVVVGLGKICKSWGRRLKVHCGFDIFSVALANQRLRIGSSGGVCGLPRAGVSSHFIALSRSRVLTVWGLISSS